MQSCFEEADDDKSGLITRRQFERHINEEGSRVAKSLGKAGIPTGDAQTLFTVLDADLSGAITFEELLAGCARIRGAAGSMEWDMLTMQATIRMLAKQLRRLHKEVRHAYPWFAHLLLHRMMICVMLHRRKRNYRWKRN